MKKRSTKKPNKSQPMQASASRDPLLPDWSDLDAKKQVVQDIIGDILLKPELGKLYVESDKAARDAFKLKINVPDDVKIIFLPAGDSDISNGGSAIIELPAPGTGTMSPDEKLEQFLCTYNPW